MKKCSKCGVENEVESKYCSNCGEELKDNIIDTSKPIDFSNQNNDININTNDSNETNNTIINNEPINNSNTVNTSQTINSTPSKKMKKKKWWLLLLIPVGLIALWLIGIFVYAVIYATVETFSEDDSNTGPSNNTVIENNSNNTDDTVSNNNSSNTYKLDTPFTFDDLEITISSNYSFVTLDNKFSKLNNSSVIKIPVTVKNLKNETHSLNMFYISFFGSQGIELDTVWTYFDDSVEDGGDLKTEASYTKYFYILYDGDGTYSIEFDNWANKIDIDIDIKK